MCYTLIQFDCFQSLLYDRRISEVYVNDRLSATALISFSFFRVKGAALIRKTALILTSGETLRGIYKENSEFSKKKNKYAHLELLYELGLLFMNGWNHYSFSFKFIGKTIAYLFLEQCLVNYFFFFSGRRSFFVNLYRFFCACTGLEKCYLKRSYDPNFLPSGLFPIAISFSLKGIFFVLHNDWSCMLIDF